MLLRASRQVVLNAQADKSHSLNTGPLFLLNNNSDN